MTPFYLLLSVIFSVCLAVGQVLFKTAALSVGKGQGNFLIAAAFNPWVIAAFVWYGATSFLWIYILMRVSLSQAYPFALLGALLVPLLSWQFFGERMPANYWIGGALVIGGLALAMSRSS